ncbi:MAG: efflux RND transporter permease subunit, partial [Bryobacteraceae bacterium]
MNYMYSINSSTGSTSITVDYDDKTAPNIDQVLTQLRSAQAQTQLPAQVIIGGLSVQKSLSSPLMLIALGSPKGTYNAAFLANYAYINLVDELTRVPGIARAQVFGGQYAMRCWVKPDQLAKLHVTVPQIVQALQSQNNVNPAGQIGAAPVPPGQLFTYTVRTQGRLVTPEQFGEIVLRANPDGSILRLKDVARIELGSQNYNFYSRFNGKPAAAMAIYQLPGSNAVADAQRLRARIAELSRTFPPDLTYTVALDTTEAVSASIRDIVYTLAIALGLVIFVVYLFLQGWRATLIPLLAVPVSLIGTFAVFPMLGFSINTLSLFGLVLAIGLVVDDAIVVVEAVERHIEEGLSPRDAALQAMREVSGPVVAIALILAAVFIPTVFIPGITGHLYQQFAVTIAISVLFSAFNALSLSPALAALLLKPRDKHKRRGPLAWFFARFNGAFAKSTNGYLRLSQVLIHKAVFGLLLLGAITVAAVFIGKQLPSSFVPEEDYGYVYVSLQLPEAASIERTSEAASQLEEILAHTPGVQSYVSVIGFSLLTRVSDSYHAFFFVQEKPWGERTTPEEQNAAIRNHISREMGKIKDGIGFSFSPPAIPGVGTAGGVTFMLEDRSGGDLQFLTDNVNKFVAAARKRPEIAGLTASYLPAVPQKYIDVDRAKVMSQGVNVGDVYQTLQAFMGGYLVNYFNRFGRQWQVYVEAEGPYRTRAEDVGQFYVANNHGGMVPLSAVTDVKSSSGPEFTMRYNEYHAAQLNLSAAPGYSSGQAMKALEDVFAQTMPAEMGYDYTGMSYQEQKAAQGVPPSAIFGLSVLFVFLILAAQYESWSLPFSVLLTTPVAVLGAYWFLWGRHFDNDVYAQIGLVMLIGLSAKNAILMVEYSKTELERGKSAEDAALTGARIRLRPILITAFAFILGCVPLAIATGSGAVSRQVLGTAVIGGMLAASLIAIFFIPLAFDVIERISHRFSRKRRSA